jgi:peptidoglycan/LPS O-acetylase OafA/YrhL
MLDHPATLASTRRPAQTAVAAHPYFPGVNALRGVAATLVVVEHAGLYASQAAGVPLADVLKVDFGALGVLSFFTISGFVIGLNRHLPTPEFLARRALRIYPGFWAAYALSAAIVLLAGKETGFSWSAFFLIPQRGYPLIYITFWTLVFEVFFYALAAAVFSLRLSDRALTALALFWILAIQTMYPYMTGMRPLLPGMLIPVAQYNLFFALGLICALNYDTLARPSIEKLLAVAVAAGAALPLLPATPHVTTLLVFGIGLSAILLVVTKIERWPGVLLVLGNASYGLFLLHVAPLVVGATFLTGYGLSTALLWPVLFLIGVAVSIPFGLAEFAFHRTALRWMLSRLHAKRAGIAEMAEAKSGS